MNLFDSHCHLESSRFQNDRREVMARMTEAGVSRCVLAGSDRPSNENIVELASESSIIYGVVGVHPHEAKDYNEGTLGRIETWLKQTRIVGIGEIGLDYFYDLSPRDTQKDVLLVQLALAHRLKVPVVFHVRDAHGDMLDLLREHRGELPAGVMHCFSGSLESARSYLDMGLYLSFAGPVTFRNANKLQEVAKYCPIDRIMIETDSPYLAPVPMRGKRNEPAFVSHIARTIAALRGIPDEEFAQCTYDNTCRLFGLHEVGV